MKKTDSFYNTIPEKTEDTINLIMNNIYFMVFFK